MQPSTSTVKALVLSAILGSAACNGPERPAAATPDAGFPRTAARSGAAAPATGAPAPEVAPDPAAVAPPPPALPAIAPTDPKLRADLPALPRFADQRAVVDHALAAVHAAPDEAQALAALGRVRQDDAALLARGQAFAAHRKALVAQEGARLATLTEAAIDAAQTADKARWTEPVVAAVKALAREAFGRAEVQAGAALPAPPPITEEELALVAELQSRRCRLAADILRDPKRPEHIDATILAFQKSDGARLLELRPIEEAALGIRDNEARGDAVDVDHFAAGDPGLDHARRVWRACDGLVQQLKGAWNPDLPPAKQLYVPAMVQVWLPFEVPN